MLKHQKYATLQELKLFKKAYLMMIDAFNAKYREQKSCGKIPYFEHIEEVMRAILYLPNSTPQQAIIALLHDAIEDIPTISFKSIIHDFNQDIAKKVEALTKFNRSENKWINATKYLQRFQNIQSDILVIKFADRLHNLQTLEGIKIRKVIRKIIETERFFYFDVGNNMTLRSLQNQIKQTIQMLKSYLPYKIMYLIYRGYYNKKYQIAQESVEGKKVGFDEIFS